MSSLPSTPDRVPLHTASDVNAAIRRRTEESVVEAATEGRDALDRRLSELDREWDVERMIEANASSLTLLFVLLGAFVTPWLLIVPGLIASFLLQHALQGWCPPVPILRRFGFRTQREIDEERFALKALRGDFDLPPTTLRGDAALAALQAARR